MNKINDKYQKYNQVIIDKIKSDEKLNSFIQELTDEQINQNLALLYSQAIENEKCKNCLGKKKCSSEEAGYQSYLMLIDGKIVQRIKPCEYVEINNFDLIDVLYYPTNAFVGKTDKSNLNARGAFFLEQKNIMDGKSNKGTYLYGRYGTGKSFLTFKLVNDLASRGKKVIFVLVPELIRNIKANLDKPTYMDDLIVKMKRVDVLVLDDIGGEINTSFSRDEILFPILDSRMNEGKITFFTSNYSLKELEEHFAMENKKLDTNPIPAGRIMERIRKLAKEMLLDDKNYRN